MNIHIGDTVTVNSDQFPTVVGKVGVVTDRDIRMNVTESGICVTFGAVSIYVRPTAVTVVFPRKD